MHMSSEHLFLRLPQPPPVGDDVHSALWWKTGSMIEEIRTAELHLWMLLDQTH